MNAIAIKAFKCKKCGKVMYPEHERCLECKGRDFEEIAPQGSAKLLAYTQIFNLPWGFDERFLIIGVGQFENGVKAMGQVKADRAGGDEDGHEAEGELGAGAHGAGGARVRAQI